MPNEDQHAPSVVDSTSRRYLFAIPLMAVVIGAVLFVTTPQ
jgi:hypothetical protein